MTFFICDTCHQVHLRLVDTSKPLVCCGQPTIPLVPNREMPEEEMHRATIKKLGSFVTVDVNEAHPMLPIHHIRFLCLETNQGFQVKDLGESPFARAEFILSRNEEIVNVHVFCSLHHLWSLH